MDKNKRERIAIIIILIILLLGFIISGLYSLGFRFNIDYTENIEDVKTDIKNTNIITKNEKDEILSLFNEMSDSFRIIGEACKEKNNDKIKANIIELDKVNNKIQKTKLDKRVKSELNKSIEIWNQIPSMLDDNIFDYNLLFEADVHIMNAIELYNYIYGDEINEL